MGLAMQSNLAFTLAGTLTNGAAPQTVAISNDTELNLPCDFQDASIVIRSLDGKTLERMIASADGAGLMTISKRGLDQSDSEVENAGLRKEWRTGAPAYLTLLASDTFDRTSDNIVSGSITFDNGEFQYPTFVDTAARDARYTAPQNGDVAFVLTGLNSGLQYYFGGIWNLTGTSTPVPFASPIVAGIVQEATIADIAAGTQTGTTGADLFLNPRFVIGSSLGIGDANKIPRLNGSGKLDSSFLPTPGLKTFSIVAAAGGDYTSISSAIFAGATSIWVEPGSYSEVGRQVNTGQHVYIFGADAANTFLSFTAPAFAPQYISMVNSGITFKNLTINVTHTDGTYQFVSASGTGFCEFEDCSFALSSTCTVTSPEFFDNSQTLGVVNNCSFTVTAFGTLLLQFGSGGKPTNYNDCNFTGNKISLFGNFIWNNCHMNSVSSLQLFNPIFNGGTITSVTNITNGSGTTGSGSIVTAIGLTRTGALNTGAGNLSVFNVSNCILNFTGGNAVLEVVNSLEGSEISTSTFIDFDTGSRITGNKIRTNGGNVNVGVGLNFVSITGNTFDLAAGSMGIDGHVVAITGNTFITISQLVLSGSTLKCLVVGNGNIAGAIVNSGVSNVVADNT